MNGRARKKIFFLYYSICILHNKPKACKEHNGFYDDHSSKLSASCHRTDGHKICPKRGQNFFCRYLKYLHKQTMNRYCSIKNEWWPKCEQSRKSRPRKRLYGTNHIREMSVDIFLTRKVFRIRHLAVFFFSFDISAATTIGQIFPFSFPWKELSKKEQFGRLSRTVSRAQTGLIDRETDQQWEARKIFFFSDCVWQCFRTHDHVSILMREKQIYANLSTVNVRRCWMNPWCHNCFSDDWETCFTSTNHALIQTFDHCLT